jgi:alpha-mannosidase
MRRVAPIPAQLALVLLVLLQPLRGAEALPACSLAGAYFYQADASVVITFAADGGGGGGGYTLSCSGSCGWSRANVSVDTLRPWSPALFIAFDNGVLTQAWALAPCSAQRVIYFGGSNVGAPWCAVGNAACAVPVDPLWTQPGARVHLAEVSHSDIFWLGSQDDVEIDATNINASLALMLANPRFVWQHECILFLRVYVEMYPDAEAALLARIAEGRFDIGGTFTEGFESTMVNEILARQMYLGRKWFVERYPGLDSAVVAFHQDGPLRAIQMPQVYAKAGMKYMKPSRLSEDIVFWAGLDGASGLVSFPQWQYCEGASQWAIDAQDVLYKMALFAPQYAAAGLPPSLPVTWGCDYAPPDNATQLFADWAALSATERVPELVYSNFKTWGDEISAARDALPVVIGERPNLWYIENSPTHHYMWSNYRDAGRLLPAAESFAAFRSILEGDFAVSYPVATLDAAWLNLSLADHGISAEPTPKGQGLPSWLVNDASPDTADQLYADKWRDARNAADAMLGDAQAWLAGAVDVSGAAPPGARAAVTVFNALSWARSDAVLDLAPPAGGGAFSVVDASGAAVPSQLSANGSGLVFVADVPPFGYTTYFVVPQAAAAMGEEMGPLPPRAPAAAVVGAPWTAPFTNAFYTLAPGAGGLASVVDLETGASLFDTSHYDVGEWMELQYTGMGASETHSYDAPWLNASTFARLGNLSTQISWTCLESGPVRTVFATALVPTAHSSVRLVVEAYAAIKRLDVRVSILGWDSAFGVVNRVVFPVNTRSRNVSYAGPFGVVRVGLDEAEDGYHDMWLRQPGPQLPKFERAWAMSPREVGDWVRAEATATVGVTLSSSVGAVGWRDATGAYGDDATVLAPEMLLHTNSNRSPFLPEPGDHNFLFSITASAPGWQTAWRAGVSPNNPLRSVSRALPAGPAAVAAPAGAATSQATAGAPVQLPLAASFLNVSGEAWATAVKKEDGAGRSGLIVRLFAVTGADAPAPGVRVASYWPLAGGAARTNLIELEARDVPGTRGAAAVDIALGGWAIETLRLGVLDAAELENV